MSKNHIDALEVPAPVKKCLKEIAREVRAAFHEELKALRAEVAVLKKSQKSALLTEPFIFKTLDISTGHMTAEDNEKLESCVREGRGHPVYELAEYGYLVYIGELDENWPKGMMSAAFRKVLKTAAELGCDYVRFDRDGRSYDELKTFDW